MPVPNPWIAPAIQAGASIIGAGMNANSGGNQDTTNYANMQMMERGIEENRYLSNTAHQREVQDLKRAGLNPTLSAGGNGASTPSAPSATMQTQAPRVIMPDVLSAFQLYQDQQKIKIQDDATKEAIAKSKAERGLIGKKTENEGKGVLKTLDQKGGDLLRYIFEEGKKQLKPNQYYKPPGNSPPNMAPLIKGMD